jgi:hydrogenase maturation protease
VKKITVLGIGNLLMSDEGVGIHVLNELQKVCPLPHVEYVDGGTGGLQLLEYFTASDLIVLIDAALDGKPLGTVTQLEPRYSKDYPRTLVAHDLGLKDLLDALVLLECTAKVVLFTISIADIATLSLDLSPELETSVAAAAQKICGILRALPPPSR